MHQLPTKIYPGLNIVRIQQPLVLGHDPSQEVAALVHSNIDSNGQEYHILADDYIPPFYTYAFKTADFIISYQTHYHESPGEKLA